MEVRKETTRIKETFAFPKEKTVALEGTLKIITLYRAAAHLTGLARRSECTLIEKGLSFVRREMLTNEPYDQVHSLVQYFHEEYVKRYGQVVLLGETSSKPINHMDALLECIAPTARIQELEVCMNKRYLRWETLYDTVALGYLDTRTRHPEEIRTIIQNAQALHGQEDLTNIRIKGFPPTLYFKNKNLEESIVYKQFLQNIQQ
jgi:hypothetical protein